MKTVAGLGREKSQEGYGIVWAPDGINHKAHRIVFLMENGVIEQGKKSLMQRSALYRVSIVTLR